MGKSDNFITNSNLLSQDFRASSPNEVVSLVEIPKKNSFSKELPNNEILKERDLERIETHLKYITLKIENIHIKMESLSNLKENSIKIIDTKFSSYRDFFPSGVFNSHSVRVNLELFEYFSNFLKKRGLKVQECISQAFFDFMLKLESEEFLEASDKIN
jgi:hypothetical protein